MGYWTLIFLVAGMAWVGLLAFLCTLCQVAKRADESRTVLRPAAPQPRRFPSARQLQ
jgi:hypothetical protein